MSAAPHLTAIPYRPDSAALFAAIRHLPCPVWLDSGKPGSQYGRFDIISAAPELLLTCIGSQTRLHTADGREQLFEEEFFTLLRQHLPRVNALPPDSPLAKLPFQGGALGYFGYDLGRQLEYLPSLARRDLELPDAWVGIYPWAIVQDHEQRQSWLLGPAPGAHNPLEYHLKSILEYKQKIFKINTIEPEVNANKYAGSVARIQQYIRAGDCYQVNYAQRFSARYSGDPFTAYLALRDALPSPFSAYLELGPGQAVLSLSPERFVRLRGGQVKTSPIKGTSARAGNPTDDLRAAQRLQHSVKDRAENLMIVDLLRNDLSKTCVDVAVPELFALQSFANVHHLVSTVTGTLRPGADALALLKGCFPGGSITGAPKIRAMEIIEELEPCRRSVYCGSIGYLSADGSMDTSIAIRTLACADGSIHCWGGGGIVADSVVEQEYQESINKVKLLLDTLQQQFGID